MEIQSITITKVTADAQFQKEDVVAVEARYTVLGDGFPTFSFTCTPSHLEEMVTGALYSRKHIVSFQQIDSIKIDGSFLFVTTRDVSATPVTTSAIPELTPEQIFHSVKTIFSNPDTLFNRTGCAHSCSLLRNGEILCTIEDIGRHNALDKVIGFALRGGIPMSECAVITSGRISGDYMAKIIHAGFPIAVSRAAVTSEAVRLAKEHGVTLYGFVRGNSANLYTE